LGEVVLGKVAGRTSRDEVTIFKSLGMAVEDVAAAHLAYVKQRSAAWGAGLCCNAVAVPGGLLTFTPLRPAFLHHFGDLLARFGRHLAAAAGPSGATRAT
jgi:hypothetical protein